MTLAAAIYILNDLMIRKFINILLEYALWRIIKNTHSYIKSFIQYFAYEYLNHINQGMVYD